MIYRTVILMIIEWLAILTAFFNIGDVANRKSSLSDKISANIAFLLLAGLVIVIEAVIK